MKLTQSIVILSVILLFSFGSASKVEESENQVVFYDDFVYSGLTFYDPVVYYGFYDTLCGYPYYTLACYSPFYYDYAVYLWRKNGKENEMKLRVESEFKKSDKNLESELKKELSSIKKELYGNEKVSLSEKRQNAYTFKSLNTEIQLNRIRELEQFISKNSK